MDDIESRKKEILKRLNAKIKAARAFQGSVSSSKGSLSSRSLSAKGGLSALKGAKTGEQYIKDMRNRIPPDTKILISSKTGSMEEYSSQNSLAANNRIKFDGRVRDFLAQKRSVDSSIVYKKPWVGGSDHGKSSRADHARTSLSSLSSLNKPKQSILESHTGQSRLKSILKPQNRPISTRSNITKTTTVNSATSRVTSATSRVTSVTSSKISSRPDSNSASESASDSDSGAETSESASETAKSTRSSTSKSIFSWFAKKESPSKQSDTKALKSRPIDKQDRITKPQVKSPSRHVESAEQPTRNAKTPAKSSEAPIRTVKTPAKSTERLTRTPKTPDRDRSKPVQTPFKPMKNQDPPDISRCQYCSRPFNADRLEKHESICIKTSQARKTFDSSKKRLEGTELSVASRSKSAPAKSRKKSEIPAKQSNWRKKHEELIESLRQAKAVSAHIAKGGKASDIPIVAAKNDGTPCPHCSRKFGEGSFERHVQICANLKHFGPRKTK